jgi:hypothetical protein
MIVIYFLPLPGGHHEIGKTKVVFFWLLLAPFKLPLLPLEIDDNIV